MAEFHHDKSVKAGDPLFVLAPSGPSVSRARDTAAEARRWRGVVFGVVDAGQTALDASCDAVLRLPARPEPLAAFSHTLPVQLFAYHVAIEKFRDAGAEIAD